METYREFLDRINSFEKPTVDFGGKDFKCNPSVALKVNRDNTFKNFYGDTVVFALDDRTKTQLSSIVYKLYNVAPECFCEKLRHHTFHVTLHDLINSPVLSDIAEQMFNNELAVAEKIRELQIHSHAPIRFKSKYIFNMVNTSLVLGLYPVDKDNYTRLMKMYSIFDGVKKLDYPLTPHITLAYFNVNGFNHKSAQKLENIVAALNNELDIDISAAQLFYQKFRSMNDYIDIINLIN